LAAVLVVNYLYLSLHFVFCVSKITEFMVLVLVSVWHGAQSMEAYEVSNPVPVGFFGAQAVILGTHDCVQLFAQPG